MSSASVMKAKWLELWTGVLEKVKETGGMCFVIAKDKWSGDRVLEGKAQGGQLNVARLAAVKIEWVYY